MLSSTSYIFIVILYFNFTFEWNLQSYKYWRIAWFQTGRIDCKNVSTYWNSKKIWIMKCPREPIHSISNWAGLHLTSSQFKNLSNQHETWLSKRVLLPIHLLSIVWQVTVLFRFFLGREWQHRCALQFPNLLAEWI